MKILHVTKKYPDALGGDTVVVSNLQKYQQAAGHNVAILTTNCREIKNGPHIYKFGLRDTAENLDSIGLKRVLSLLALLYQAFRVIARERPDVIHTHSVDMAFIVSFAARFFRVPLIHTFHIVTFYDGAQSPLRRKTELLLAKAAKPRLVTAPNLHDVTALQNAGLPQAVLVPNGVDLEFWRPTPDAEKSTDFTFLSIGRLEPQKGYEYLIKATHLLRTTSRQTFRVIVVGDGKQKEYLRKLARQYDVQDIMYFLGRKSPEYIRLHLSQADAAIFPSLYETTPLTLLEAWASGAAVITTSVGIMRDVPPTTPLAYIAQPGDDRSLKSAMQLCMADKKLQRSIAAAGRKEVKKYAWPDIAQHVETLYGSVL